MKKKLSIIAIIVGILLAIYLATRNMDLPGFLQRLHGG